VSEERGKHEDSKRTKKAKELGEMEKSDEGFIRNKNDQLGRKSRRLLKSGTGKSVEATGNEKVGDRAAGGRTWISDRRFFMNRFCKEREIGWTNGLSRHGNLGTRFQSLGMWKGEKEKNTMCRQGNGGGE